MHCNGIASCIRRTHIFAIQRLHVYRSQQNIQYKFPFWFKTYSFTVLNKYWLKLTYCVFETKANNMTHFSNLFKLPRLLFVENKAWEAVKLAMLYYPLTFQTEFFWNSVVLFAMQFNATIHIQSVKPLFYGQMVYKSNPDPGHIKEVAVQRKT